MSFPFAAQPIGAAIVFLVPLFYRHFIQAVLALTVYISIKFFTVMIYEGFYQVKIYVGMKLALWLSLLEKASILSKERKSILVVKIILRGLKSLFCLIVGERSNAISIIGVYLGYRAFYIGYNLALVSTATSRYPGIPILEAVEQLRVDLGLVAGLRLWA